MLGLQPCAMDPEAQTVAAMIGLYCRAHHSAETVPCEACAGLLAYALERIEKCPFGSRKPVCNKCTVHCYKPEMRARIRVVMRFAGPRMLLRHPRLAIRHLVRSRRYFE
ncbi:nitrous oxide-stimulated promoter family protein [Pontiella sp.]|uniref:nitrous oxide-stimulated promoter family protein n=2 Tax=Pontiella sp. TaxID=2837462 RepID=UPI0035678FF0